MSKASLNSKPQTQHASVSEYSDFERRELAIALNSRKRGDLVLALFHESEKEQPDLAKIDRLNQQAKELILEKQEIYNGNKEIQNKVIETFKDYNAAKGESK